MAIPREKIRLLSILFLLLNITLIVFGNCNFRPGIYEETKYDCSDASISTIGTELELLFGKEESRPLRLMDLKLSNLKCIEKLAAGWYNMDVPLKILQMRNIMEINAIESDSFNAAQFKRLRKLEFINVPIKVFKNGAFNGLTDLRELQIHRAVVAEVEENMLAPLQNLGEFNILDCRGNGLEINHFFGPVKMERLKYVTIKHCPFKDKIIESTFSGLSSVVHLNLNGNEIEEIGEKSLDVLLQTLKVLDLSHNKLQTLPVDFLKKIMRKKDIVIFFSENRWRCDIVEFIEKNRILNIKIEKINCRWDDIPTMQNEILVSSASEFSIEASSTSIETTQHSEEKTPSNSISTFDENSTPIESEHVTILDMCTEAKQKLLPLPSKERILLIYAEDGHLFIDTDSFGSKFELIAFRVTSVREVDGNTVNCMTDFQSENSIDRVQNMNSKQNIQIEPKLHQAYQFCLLERRKNIAIPLSYVFFHLNNGEDPEPWILGQHKLIFIMVCVLGALLVPVSGIGISFVLAIFFPKMIRSQPPKKSVLLTLKGSIKPKRPQDNIKRLEKFPPGSFYTNEVNGYISFGVVPPPLPPRSKLQNVMDVKCCDGENCECYCEL